MAIILTRKPKETILPSALVEAVSKTMAQDMGLTLGAEPWRLRRLVLATLKILSGYWKNNPRGFADLLERSVF